MVLGSKTQYALVLIKEVKDSSIEVPVTLHKVSTKYGISCAFLEQVARKLRLADLLKSKRGPGGGYIAGDRLEQASLKDVLLAIGAWNFKDAVDSQESRAMMGRILEELSKKLSEIKL